MLDLVWTTRTHPGKRRKVNQDALLALPTLFVVADGMGGHDAGEIASAITVDVMGTRATAGSLSRPTVLAAIRSADEQIGDMATRSGTTMGTTVCGVAVTQSAGHNRIGVFNVGDSRVYRLSPAGFHRLTHDHSVVQELIDAGSLSAGEASSHPDRSVITRSLGTADHLDIDWVSLEAHGTDRFLITSDGLTKELTDEEICRVLVTETDIEQAADALLRGALDAGGRDNVSLILVDVVGVHDRPPLTDEVIDPLDVETTPRFDDALDADTTPATLRS